MLVGEVGNRLSEKELSLQVTDMLARRLSPEYTVHAGKPILYKIQINALGQITHRGVDDPTRGQYAFETDILVQRRTETIPLVVIELKCGRFSSHDILTYASKGRQHKSIYPYLRYGLVAVGAGALGRRFVTHKEGFDFAMTLPDVASHEIDLTTLIQKQLESAERLSKLMRSDRIRFTRYEETVYTSE